MQVPVEVFKPIAEDWLAQFEARAAGLDALAASSQTKADTWRRRLSDESGRWYSFAALDEALVDEFLAAADALDMWHLPPLDAYGPQREAISCHDCGKACSADDYRPLDLMRVQPDSPGGVIWDSTKRCWKRVPEAVARAGGRRFRRYDLCRRCAGEALRQRAANPNTRLRTKDRVEPKRGGRPRLLTDDELRAAHHVYEEAGLSINALATRLVETREKGTHGGYVQALLYGWRRLGLKLRPKGEQIAISRHGREVRRAKAA